VDHGRINRFNAEAQQNPQTIEPFMRSLSGTTSLLDFAGESRYGAEPI
jgi:hypothetical protein